jgi:hypothetical protein
MRELCVMDLIHEWLFANVRARCISAGKLSMPRHHGCLVTSQATFGITSADVILDFSQLVVTRESNSHKVGSKTMGPNDESGPQ